MANLFSGISDLLSGGQMGTALDRLSRSSQSIYAVPVPDLMKLIPQLQLQVQQGTMTPAEAQAALAQVQGSMSPAAMQAAQAAMQGTMTPAQAQAVLQSESRLGGVQSDQGTIEGQRAALAQLADIAQNKGLTEADRAQYAALMNQQNANAAQQRAAQIQQLQMQGNAGAGAELAARLAGTQSSANANAAAGAQLAQSAQARALQAIQAGIAGNQSLNSQMFEQAAKKAAAQDLVNQFNAQAQNTIGLQNAQMAQQAGLQNFQTANQIALANQQAQQAAAAQNAQMQQAANQQNFAAGNQFALSNQAAQQAANEANAARQQQANQQNFNMANTIAGTNVGIANQQAQLPYNAAQANFTNLMNKAVAGSTADYRAGGVMADLAGKQIGNTVGGLTGLFGGTSGAAGAVGNLVKDAATGLWKAINPGSVLTAAEKALIGTNTPINYSGDWGNYSGGGDYSGYTTGSGADTGGSLWDTVSGWFSDENLKTDKKELSDEDIDKIMGHLTGYKYRYKGAKTNPEQVGIMAQDMPKESVIDTPAGKMVQGPEALNQALAVLANQHQRLKKLEGK